MLGAELAFFLYIWFGDTRAAVWLWACRQLPAAAPPQLALTDNRQLLTCPCSRVAVHNWLQASSWDCLRPWPTPGWACTCSRSSGHPGARHAAWLPSGDGERPAAGSQCATSGLGPSARALPRLTVPHAEMEAHEQTAKACKPGAALRAGRMNVLPMTLRC